LVSTQVPTQAALVHRTQTLCSATHRVELRQSASEPATHALPDSVQLPTRPQPGSCRSSARRSRTTPRRSISSSPRLDLRHRSRRGDQGDGHQTDAHGVPLALAERYDRCARRLRPEGKTALGPSCGTWPTEDLAASNHPIVPPDPSDGVLANDSPEIHKRIRSLAPLTDRHWI
jgi:hypothetical protein